LRDVGAPLGQQGDDLAVRCGCGRRRGRGRG
jgi:hypothetical protein